MKSTTFINRTNEFKILEQSITPSNPKEKNKVIILNGNTGIGKSRFVKEFFNRFYKDYIKIKVSSLGTSNSSIDSLFFFNRIYEEVAYAIDGKCEKKKRLMFKGLGLTAGIFSLNVDIEENGDYDHQTIRKYKYILNALKKKNTRVILDIENAHLFDAASFKLLSSLIKCTYGNTYILEYTTTEENNQDMQKFIWSFESINNIELEIYRLEKLMIGELKKIVDQIMPTSEDINIISQIYNASGGNLMEIYLLPYIKNNVKREVLHTLLGELDNRERIILNLLFLNKGVMKMNTLYEIFHNNNNPNILLTLFEIKNIINELNNKELINIKYNIIEISHDSIIKELTLNKGEFAFYTAFQIIERFYFDSINKNDDAVLMLLYLYTLTNDPKVITILPEIQRIAMGQKYPEAILEKMNDIYLSLYQSGHNQNQLDCIIMSLVEIAYIIGDYERAYLELAKIYNDNLSQHIAYKGAILALRNKGNDLQELKYLIEKNKRETHLCLILELHLLIAHMETEKSIESIKLAETLINKREYKNYIEYIYLLENYSEFKSNKEAVQILQKCIYYYEQHQRHDLAIRCKISIASRQAYIGNYDIACEMILLVEENYHHIALRYEYILNNQAAIRILKNDFSLETEQLLCDAIVLSLNEYERTIIKSNLLIVYSKNKKYTLAKNIALEFEDYIESMSYKYEELTHIILQNLRYYYIETNDTISIQYNTEKLLKLKEENIASELSDYIEATITEKPIKDINHQWALYSSLSYRPDFLGYWQFEIPKNL